MNAEPISLPAWLAQRAALTPDRLALINAQGEFTFSQLYKMARQTAGHLAGLGVKESSKVAVLMRNHLTYIPIVHAINMLGAILVPLNTRLTAAELVWQLDNVKADWLLVDSANETLAHQVTQQRPDLVIVNYPAQMKNLPIQASSLAETYRLDRTLCIIHTSGTTGQPKGAQLTYGNFWWSAIGSALNLGYAAADRWLACLPLFHVGGLSILYRSVIYGIPVVLHETFDAEAVNQSIDKQRVTIISVVAVMLSRLIETRGNTPFPTWLRCVLLGGGSAPHPLLETCAALQIPVVQTYGLTETASQVATLDPADALRKLGSAGKPLFPNMIRILNQQDQPAIARQAGEIVVRGPSVTSGYYHASAATAHILRDGWLHTGDIGYLDEEGYLYVLDRRDDLVITGGENVYPAEVEAVLLGHPAVEEAGVIGIPDSQWGQVPIAIIRLKTNYSLSTATIAEEIMHYCAAQLAGYKRPRQIRITNQPLPRNAAGKLLRRLLTP